MRAHKNDNLHTKNKQFVNRILQKIFLVVPKKIKRSLQSFLIFLFARQGDSQSAVLNQMRITESKYDPYVREIFFGNMQRWNVQEKIYQRLITTRNPVLFDVGANIGFVSLLLSRIRGSTVYSFEPVTSTFSYLQRNISQNTLTNIFPFPIGLSDKKQNVFIGIPTKKQHAHYGEKKTGLYSVYASQIGKEADAFGEIASFTTMDLFCEETGIQSMDYLKIDVEGHELSVLQGGIQSLKKFQPICQVELHPIPMQIANRKPEEIIDFFKQNGYILCVFEQDQFRHIQIDRLKKEYHDRPVELYGFPKDRYLLETQTSWSQTPHS